MLPRPRALSAVILAAIAVLLAAGGYGIFYIIQNPAPCDRTQEMRDALERATERKCDLITGDDLADIDGLVIQFEDEMPILKRLDFAGLRHLKWLTYGRTVYSSYPLAIPGNVFSGLPKNLQLLGLGANGLRELPPGVFDGLADLESLYLYTNGLRELPPDVFDGLTNLQSLHLDYNRLTELPLDVFDGLANLHSLSLGRNDLTELPPDVFDGLANLQSLYLDGNDLTEWVPDVFDGHTNLQSLYLCSLSSYSSEMDDWRRGGRVITNLQSIPLSIIPGVIHHDWNGYNDHYHCREAWPGLGYGDDGMWTGEG